MIEITAGSYSGFRKWLPENENSKMCPFFHWTPQNILMIIVKKPSLNEKMHNTYLQYHGCHYWHPGVSYLQFGCPICAQTPCRKTPLSGVSGHSGGYPRHPYLGHNENFFHS